MQSYVLSDRGTPDDDSDDATVTITVVVEMKAFAWESNVGIDAIYVKGGAGGSWFYGYQPDVDSEGNVSYPGEEATEGVDHGTPPTGSRATTKPRTRSATSPSAGTTRRRHPATRPRPVRSCRRPAPKRRPAPRLTRRRRRSS